MCAMRHILHQPVEAARLVRPIVRREYNVCNVASLFYFIFLTIALQEKLSCLSYLLWIKQVKVIMFFLKSLFFPLCLLECQLWLCLPYLNPAI